jgi:hypothetical protein
MSGLEFGLRRGLSVPLVQDRSNELLQAYQLQKQNQIAQENKAKLFADDFDYNNAINEFDNPLIKENARKQISSIGSWIRNNPGWERDVNKRIEYKTMVRELKDNTDLNRGLQSDANYKQFQKDLSEKSKNPQLFDADSYGKIGEQWNNYLKYGHQNGEEAARVEGRKPFLYQQPQDFVDLATSGLEKGNKFNQFNIQPVKGGGLGSYQEIPDEDALTSVATDEYARNKRQYDKEYASKGFQSPLEYAKSNIRSGIKTKVDYGDYNSLVSLEKWKAKASQTGPEGVWSKDIANVDKSVVNGEILKDALGATPPIKIRGENGNIVDLTGHEVNYSGRNTYLGDGKKHGVKHFEVSVNLPFDEAAEKGIVTKNYLKDDDINSAWRKNARIKTVKNAQGDDVKVVEMYDFVPFDINNATYQGIYDQKATVAKFQEAPEEGYQEEDQPVSGSGKYKWNGKEWVSR